MRTIPITVLALAASLCATQASAQGGRGQREVKSPSPFVGTWLINVAKSTYEGIPEEQRRFISIRTLDVNADGWFVQTHRNVSKVRAQSFSFWVGKPDGPEFIEFNRLNGTELGNRITIKTVTERQWAVTFKNQRGEVVLVDTWTISADGSTMTIDRKDTTPNRPPTHSVEVYDSEKWAMPGQRAASR